MVKKTFITKRIEKNVLELGKLIKKEGIPVSKLIIFGSYAKNHMDSHSDIDLLVEAPRGMGLFAFVDLKHKLEDALKKKVDLVTYDALHPRLRDRILQQQQPIL